MKQRKVFYVGLTAGVIILAVVLFIGIRHGKKLDSVPEYVFTYAENQPGEHPAAKAAQYFADLVFARSAGRIQILVYNDGQKGNENEVIRQMRYGGIDFARVSLSQLAEFEPELNVLQMPYLYRNAAHMWKILDGEVGRRFLSCVEKVDLVGLSWYDAGARSFYCTDRPITRLEDIKDMTIRVQESDLMVDVIGALGAKAVKISYEEVYSYLERGLVDGAENNFPSYESMNHYVVAPYFSIDEHTRVPEMQICSKYTWAKLSGEDQSLIAQCAVESALYERELWKIQEKQSRDHVTELGARIIELSPEEKERFQAAMAGVYEKYCGDHMDAIEQIITDEEQN